MISKALRSIAGRSAHLRGARTRIGKSATIDNIQRRRDAIRIGTNTIILGQLLVFRHGGEIVLGDDCFVGENARIWSAGRVAIGNRVLISHDVNIFDNDTHPFDMAARHRHYLSIASHGHPEEIDLGEAPVVVEDDAWIAAKAMVLKGVTIGRGAVVGSGSVVTRDVEPFTVVVGNPARLVRQLDPSGVENDMIGGIEL
jgi:acetyltransferase-like isoleucine patch superfamily enzyme